MTFSRPTPDDRDEAACGGGAALRAGRVASKRPRSPSSTLSTADGAGDDEGAAAAAPPSSSFFEQLRRALRWGHDTAAVAAAAEGGGAERAEAVAREVAERAWQLLLRLPTDPSMLRALRSLGTPDDPRPASSVVLFPERDGDNGGDAAAIAAPPPAIVERDSNDDNTEVVRWDALLDPRSAHR